MFKVGDKVKTRDGMDARILCVDFGGNGTFKEKRIVAGLKVGEEEYIRLYTKEGKTFIYQGGSEEFDTDLVMPVDWSKVLVDTPVWVRDCEKARWNSRHFKEVDNGYYSCFHGGLTSHTTHITSPWVLISLTEPKE